MLCFSAAMLPLAIITANDLGRREDDAGVLKNEVPDQSFVVQAAEAGHVEVALGKLASGKATSANVKDFGEMMIADHTRANEELRTLAERKGIIVSSECRTCQQKLDELNKLSGEDFDRRYVDIMIADHQDVVSKFFVESSQGKDPDIKKWATAKLPVLQYHLEAAQDLKAL